MLYKYNFVKKHKMHKLNQHFLFFLRSIRTIPVNASFRPAKYFHSSFLDVKNRIAPNNKVNKTLSEKFEVFFNTFKLLTPVDKERFYKSVLFAKDIHLYFEDDTIDVSELHKNSIELLLGNDSFEKLMLALWNSLKTNAWEIDKHYEEFFGKIANEAKTCAFCGINQLPDPRSYRADYDHLAFKGDYPISAVNVKNIAPACTECNQRYKNSKNVFYSDDERTVRRLFNYPFTHSINVEIDFSGSILPYTDIRNENGVWNLNFKPNNGFVTTWNEIYQIKDRYIREVLNVDYKIWIGEFVDEMKGRGVNDTGQLKSYFIKHFRRYAKNKLQKRYLVKSSLFKYFYKCNDASFYEQIIKQLN